MGWPRGQDPTPGSFRFGLEEGFETYLSGGSSSHGYGAAEFQVGSRPIVPHVPVPDPGTYQHLGYRTDYRAVGPVQAVPAPRATTPFTPGLSVAPTPTPSNDLVDAFPPGRGAPSDPFGRGKAKSAPQKSTPRQSGSSGFPVYYQGSQISWP